MNEARCHHVIRKKSLISNTRHLTKGTWMVEFFEGYYENRH